MMTSSIDGPRAVIAGHGDVAAGFVSAVQQIAGLGAVFRAVSNASLDVASIEAAIARAISEHRATIVFTDLPAGSCTIAARKATRALTGVSVVTGVNLPMLLDFALKGGVAPDDAAQSAAKGRDAIIVHTAPEVR